MRGLAVLADIFTVQQASDGEASAACKLDYSGKSPLTQILPPYCGSSMA